MRSPLTTQPDALLCRARHHIGNAYHEAGHAAVALALGRTVDVASVVPDRDSAARVIVDPAEDHTGPVWRRFLRKRRRQSEDVLIGMAGGLAERMWSGSWHGVGDAGDLRGVDALIAELRPDDEPAEWRRLWLRTRGMLAQHWPSVRRIAQALLKKGTLSAAETVAAYRRGLREAGLPAHHWPARGWERRAWTPFHEGRACACAWIAASVLDGVSDKELSEILRVLPERPGGARFDERRPDAYRDLCRFLEWSERLPLRAERRRSPGLWRRRRQFHRITVKCG